MIIFYHILAWKFLILLKFYVKHFAPFPNAPRQLLLFCFSYLSSKVSLLYCSLSVLQALYNKCVWALKLLKTWKSYEIYFWLRCGHFVFCRYFFSGVVCVWCTTRKIMAVAAMACLFAAAACSRLDNTCWRPIIEERGNTLLFRFAWLWKCRFARDNMHIGHSDS